MRSSRTVVQRQDFAGEWRVSKAGSRFRNPRLRAAVGSIAGLPTGAPSHFISPIQSVPLRRGSVACPIWAGGGVVTCATTLRRAAPPAAGMDQNGAGEGNRTLVISLEGCCSTIELHPHGPPAERCRPGRRPAVSAYC